MKSPQSNQGFVLPVAIGVGLIALLLGVMIIARSSQNRLTAIAQKDTARSLAVTEAGVTQLQALFSRYRPLAIYCTDTSLSLSCNTGPPTPPITWKNISSSRLDPCGITPVSGPLNAANLVQGYANQEWHGTPNDGEFRLMSYKFTPDTPSAPPQSPGMGELIVEGWINRSDSVRTSKSRLKINFRVSNDPSLSGLPGLWIQSNSGSDASSSVAIKSNIRDSTCPSDTNLTKVSQLKNQQPPPVSPPPYSFQETPGEPFSVLPVDGNTAPAPSVFGSFGSYDIGQINNSTSELTVSQPPDSNGVATFRVAKTLEKSIELTGVSLLKVMSGSDTIALDLVGEFDVNDDSKIELTSSSKLTIHCPVGFDMSGNSKIELASGSQLTIHAPAGFNMSDNSKIELASGSQLIIIAPGNLGISDNSKITLASGAQLTVHAPVGLSVNGDSRIQLADNSKFITYSHGPVNLSSGSSKNVIEQLGASPKATNVQLYVYPPPLTTPPTPPYPVTLSSLGSADEMPLFLFAPESLVTSSGTSNTKGFIWAKSWKGEANAVIAQDTSLTPADLANLKITFPARISPITAWQREPIP